MVKWSKGLIDLQTIRRKLKLKLELRYNRGHYHNLRGALMV